MSGIICSSTHGLRQQFFLSVNLSQGTSHEAIGRSWERDGEASVGIIGIMATFSCNLGESSVFRVDWANCVFATFI